MSSRKTGVVAKRQRLLTKALKKALHECVNGCGRGKAGNRYCTDCGTALPIFDGAAKSASAPAFLAKSETPTDPLCFDWGDSTDPAERERAWHEEYNRLISKPAVKSRRLPTNRPSGTRTVPTLSSVCPPSMTCQTPATTAIRPSVKRRGTRSTTAARRDGDRP